MLAKKYRFKNFNFQLFLKGEKKQNSLFLIYRMNNNQEKKFAVLAKRKLFKKATERNKIRRQIYNIIRNNLENIPAGYYLIIPLKKEKFKQIKESLLEILK
jgi:ribonuclease P protein component